MTDRLKAVEQMIVTVRKHKGYDNDKDAIEYMLVVATGRLKALWRYDETVPEGKRDKGVLKGRKKRAPKSPRILPTQAALAAQEARKTKAKAKKRRQKKKPAEPVVEAAAE